MNQIYNILMIHTAPSKKISHSPLGEWLKEEQICFLTRSLMKNQNYNVVLAVSDSTPLSKWANDHSVPSVVLKDRLIDRVLFKKRIQEMMSKFEGKWLIHSHDDGAVGYGHAIKAIFPDASHIVSRRSSDEIVGRRLQGYYRKCDAVACETQDIAYVCAKSGIASQNLHVIHGGLYSDESCTKNKRKDGRIVFGFCADYLSDNGHFFLLDAIVQLKAIAVENHFKNWEVRLFGYGNLFADVLKRAKELGVERHLIMFNIKDAISQLPDCDIMITSSKRTEVNIRQLLKGWFLGTPVICADTVGNREVAKSMHDALFYFSGSSESLGKKMYELAISEELQSDIVENGHLSLARMSDLRMAEKYLELYQSLS